MFICYQDRFKQFGGKFQDMLGVTFASHSALLCYSLNITGSFPALYSLKRDYNITWTNRCQKNVQTAIPMPFGIPSCWRSTHTGSRCEVQISRVSGDKMNYSIIISILSFHPLNVFNSDLQGDRLMVVFMNSRRQSLPQPWPHWQRSTRRLIWSHKMFILVISLA